MHFDRLDNSGDSNYFYHDRWLDRFTVFISIHTDSQRNLANLATALPNIDYVPMPPTVDV